MKPINMPQRGFTLIELIAVIVILGILAAVAVPKLVNLKQAARVATINDVEGKLKSLSTQVFAACQVTPNCPEHNFGQSFFIPALGQNIQLIRQYPDAGELDRTDQIDDLIKTQELVLTSENSRTTARWSFPNTTNCYVQYSQVGYLSSLIPLILKEVTGC